MNGTLQYVLGLNVAAFVSGLGQAQSRLQAVTSQMRTQFLGVASSLAPFVAAARAALNLGSELSDLSLQTGESASTLLVLRQAFLEAGIGAEMVAPALAMLRKALSGVNDDGQPTSEVLRRLGVDAAALRSAGAIEQFQSVSRAVANLRTQAEQTAAVMQIFGRGGARMLQLFRDPKAIESAARAVGALGPYMDRNAETFDRLSDSLGRLRLRFLEFGAGLAERLRPTMEQLARLGNGQWISAGRQVGDVLARVAMAIGRIGQAVAGALGGPQGIAMLLSRLAEAKALLAGLDMARGLASLGKSLSGASGSIGAGIAAHLTAAAPAVGAAIGAAIVARVIGGMIEGRVEGDTAKVQEEGNRLASEREQLRKRALAIQSIEDWKTVRSDISAAIARAREEREDRIRTQPMNPWARKVNDWMIADLDGHIRSLEALARGVENVAGRDQVIARNRAEAERRAEDERRKAQVEYSLRYVAAMEKINDPFERRIGEEEDAYARRILDLTGRKLRLMDEELETIQKRINSGQATQDDAAKAERLAEEYVEMRRRHIAAMERVGRTEEPKMDRARFAGAEAPPPTDRWQRVGLFVGGTVDVARRAASAAEQSATLLAKIERHLSRRPELAWA